MSFIGYLICTLLIAVALKDAIRKAPWVFYVLAIVLSVLYVSTPYVDYSVGFQLLLFNLMQKGTLATTIFVVVMYMGIFRDIDFVKHRLIPARAALSIMGCILILGHVGKYLIAYLPSLDRLSTVVLAGLGVAIACFIIMIPLGITSLQAIKRRMKAATWVKLQKWAYVFYALVYLHLLILLAPSSFSGAAGSSAEDLIVYTVVFGAYAVLRVGKAVLDHKKKAAAKKSE